MPLLPAGQTSFATLNAVTTGNGVAISLPGGAAIREAAVLVRGSAGIGAGAVQLQGSLDGTNWFALGAPVTAVASTNVYQDTTCLCAFVRATVSTTVTGGTVTVDVICSDLD